MVRRWVLRSVVGLSCLGAAACNNAGSQAPNGKGGSAAAAVRSAGTDSADALSAALIGYLALRLGCAPGAVVSADLAQRLTAAGAAPPLAARAARVVLRLVEARYGGTVDVLRASEEAREIVAALEGPSGIPVQET